MAGVLTFVTVYLTLVSLSYQLDQCPDMPKNMKFYKGQPDEFSLKALENIFGTLFKSLGEAFSGLMSNKTDMNSLNLTELFNAEGTTTLSPLTTVLPNQADSLKLNVGSILKNVLPNEVLSNVSSNDVQRQHKLRDSVLNVGNIFAELKPTTTPNPLSFNVNDNSANETWGIVVPANAVKLQIAKINQSIVVDSFQLDADQLRDPRNTINREKFARNIDLKDFNIESGLIYIVCVNLALIQGGQSKECQRCQLIKACEDTDCDVKEKIVDFQGPASQVHPYDALLHYYVYDVPLANISLVTRVKPFKQNQRCPSETQGVLKKGTSSEKFDELSNFDQFQRSDRLVPYTMLYAPVPNLLPKQGYEVEGDLSIGSDQAPSVFEKFDWPNPLIVKNYFGGKRGLEYVIGTCNQP